MGSSCGAQAPSSSGQGRRMLSGCGVWVSHCGGFLCGGTHGLDGSDHAWNLPTLGVKPVSPVLAGGFLTLHHQGDYPSSHTSPDMPLACSLTFSITSSLTDSAVLVCVFVPAVFIIQHLLCVCKTPDPKRPGFLPSEAPGPRCLLVGTVLSQLCPSLGAVEPLYSVCGPVHPHPPYPAPLL